MSIEPLNYCRQLVAHMKPAIEDPRHRNLLLAEKSTCSFADSRAHFIGNTVWSCMNSKKFVLPDGGRILDDNDLRGISGAVIRLPFPHVAVEYLFPPDGKSGANTVPMPKRIVLAWEQNDCESLQFAGVCMRILAGNRAGGWAHYGDYLLPREGCVDPSFRASDGFVGLRFAPCPTTAKRLDSGEITMEDSVGEVRALLGLLNALSCSNVTTETIAARKPPKKAADALPFDDYHVLVLRRQGERGACGAGGDHRSPREHVRRGHIRRLQTGARIWVNACVVARGAPGRVEKDYAIPANKAA